MDAETPAADAAPRAQPPARARAKRFVARTAAAVYLLLATAFCLNLAVWTPAEGAPLAACLPAGAALVLRVRSGLGAWAFLEACPAARDVWDDPVFQRRARLKEGIERFEAHWARAPAWLRRLQPLDAEGLAFLFGGETALALGTPEPAQGGARPGLLFVRLAGARGALLRWLLSHHRPAASEAQWFDLGGGLAAFGFHGARPAEPVLDERVPRTHEAASPYDAEVVLRPARWDPERAGDLAEWAGIFGLAAWPDAVRLALTRTADGVRGEGHCGLAVPAAPLEPCAPLLSATALGAAPDAAPALDLRFPLDARAAFGAWLKRQRESEKANRQWTERFRQLAESQVDLDRDLWASAGRSARLQVWPGPEASPTGLPLLLGSLPFQADPAARRALTELVRVAGRGLYDVAAPAHAREPYAVRLARDENEDYLWALSGPARPAWRVAPQGFAFVGDTSALGPRPLPLRWAALDRAAPPVPEGLVFGLRSDGARLADPLAVFVEVGLNARRDELGAAEFLRRHPDAAEWPRLARKVGRLSGQLLLSVRTAPDARSRARLEVTWRPSE